MKIVGSGGRIVGNPSFIRIGGRFADAHNTLEDASRYVLALETP